MTAQLAPTPIQKFFDNNGNPLFNGKLYSYVAGTSTPQATYTDSTMGTQNTNPVILNARGEANVWLDTILSYKLVLQDANGTQIWVVDNIPGNGVFGTVQNIAALRNITGVGVANYQAIIMDGYTTAGDGGGGTFWWNSTSTVADNGGTIIAPTGVGTGRWYRLYNGPIYANWFGADKTSTVDSTSAINSAINLVSANGGGQVLLQDGSYLGNPMLQSGVYLSANNNYFPYYSESITTVTIKANVSGDIIQTPSTQIFSCGINGIAVVGLGSSSSGSGLHFKNAARCSVTNCYFGQIADHAILIDSSCIACTFSRIIIENSVLNTSRSGTYGALEINGTDHYFKEIEVTISKNSVTSLNLYCVAVNFNGDNCFVDSIIGEISDIGIFVSGRYNRFTNCRADTNNGHGWYITGGSNNFANCTGMSNSQDTTNIYDNWITTPSSGNNIFVGCSAWNPLTKVARYNFNDGVNSASNKNFYSNCICDILSGTAGFNNGNNGSCFSFSPNPPIGLVVNSATPSVFQNTYFFTQNTSATTITNFTQGVTSQDIYILCLDANTTVQHNGSTISLPKGANILLTQNYTYHFNKNGGVWRLIGGIAI